jgi:hypothetical protein
MAIANITSELLKLTTGFKLKFGKPLDKFRVNIGPTDKNLFLMHLDNWFVVKIVFIIIVYIFKA